MDVKERLGLPGNCAEGCGPSMSKLESDPEEFEPCVSYRSSRGMGCGRILNVSQDAVFIGTGYPPNVGEDVELEIYLESQDGSPPTSVQGFVEWSGERRDSQVGFQVFLHDPCAEFGDLVSFLNSNGRKYPGIRRRAERVPLCLAVAIQSRNLFDTGLLQNISATGALLSRTRISFALGSTLRLTFVVSRRLALFDLMATVVRHEGSDAHAVRFVDMDDQVSASLTAFLAQRSREIKKV